MDQNTSWDEISNEPERPRPLRRPASVGYFDNDPQLDLLRLRSSRESHTKWLLIVARPREMDGGGSDSTEVLLPLCPRFSLQCATIAREFGLKDPQGLSIRDGQTARPQLNEDTWAILWQSYFDSGVTPNGSGGFLDGSMLPIAGRIETSYVDTAPRLRPVSLHEAPPGWAARRRLTLLSEPSFALPSPVLRARHRRAASVRSITSTIKADDEEDADSVVIDEEEDADYETRPRAQTPTPTDQSFAAAPIPLRLPKLVAESMALSRSTSSDGPSPWPTNGRQLLTARSLHLADRTQRTLGRQSILLAADSPPSPAALAVAAAERRASIATKPPTPDTSLGYPFSLVPYPSVYPHIDPYPAMPDSQIARPQRAVERVSPPNDRPRYPWSLACIYPSVYPAEPYPSPPPGSIIAPEDFERMATPVPIARPLSPRPSTASFQMSFSTSTESDVRMSTLGGRSRTQDFSDTPTTPMFESLTVPRLSPITDDGESCTDGDSFVSSAKATTFPLVPQRSDSLNATPVVSRHPSSSMDACALARPDAILFGFQDRLDLSDALAEFVGEAEIQSIERRGRFVIGLSGGARLPSILSSLVPTCPEAWQVFFVDEQLDTARHSHYRAYSNGGRVGIRPDQIHRIKRIGTPAADVAIAYEHEILEALSPADAFDSLPSFDLILLELGSSGEIGGLRPGHRLLDETEQLVSPVDNSITFTLPLINAARRVVVMASGVEAAETLSDVLEGRGDDLPAGRISVRDGRPLVWMADDGAVSATSFPQSSFWDM